MRCLALVALLVLSSGCGAAAPHAEEPLAAEEAEAPRPPPLAWEPGEETIEASGLGVAFAIRAEVERFGPAEIGTAQCGEALLHASVVDRRTFVPSEAVLARAFARAGCPLPETAVLSNVVVEGAETRASLRFEESGLEGVWAIRAVTLPRGHRVVVIVSAARTTEPLFEVVSDAPGLEDLTGSGSSSRATPSSDEAARQAMEVVFGVMRVAGEIGRSLRR